MYDKLNVKADAFGLHAAPFPTPPPGISQLEHRPTIEAGLRYWQATLDHARKRCDAHGQRIARAILRSYQQAANIPDKPSTYRMR